MCVYAYATGEKLEGVASPALLHAVSAVPSGYVPAYRDEAGDGETGSVETGGACGPRRGRRIKEGEHVLRSHEDRVRELVEFAVEKGYRREEVEAMYAGCSEERARTEFNWQRHTALVRMRYMIQCFQREEADEGHVGDVRRALGSERESLQQVFDEHADLTPRELFARAEKSATVARHWGVRIWGLQ